MSVTAKHVSIYVEPCWDHATVQFVFFILL